MDNEAIQILSTGQTTSSVFYPNAEFFVSIHGLQTGSQDWFVEYLPRQLPDSSSLWNTLHRVAFSDGNGAASDNFKGTPRYKYRLRNTSGTPANSGITAYWSPLTTERFQ